MPIDCVWTRFGEWSSCSRTCGGGDKERIRSKLIEAENGGNPCVGDGIEIEVCNAQICPEDTVSTNTNETKTDIENNKNLETSDENVNEKDNENDDLKNSGIDLERVSAASADGIEGKLIFTRYQFVNVKRAIVNISIFSLLGKFLITFVDMDKNQKESENTPEDPSGPIQRKNDKELETITCKPNCKPFSIWTLFTLFFGFILI